MFSSQVLATTTPVCRRSATGAMAVQKRVRSTAIIRTLSDSAQRTRARRRPQTRLFALETLGRHLVGQPRRRERAAGVLSLANTPPPRDLPHSTPTRQRRVQLGSSAAPAYVSRTAPVRSTSRSPLTWFQASEEDPAHLERRRRSTSRTASAGGVLANRGPGPRRGVSGEHARPGVLRTPVRHVRMAALGTRRHAP